MSARLYAGLVLGLLCFAGRARADQTVSSAAGLSQPLLDAGVSARALGLGNALAAIDEDGTALWFNPAGLAFQRGMNLGLHHDSELVDALRETAVLGLPLGGAQGAALALDYVNYGEFTATNDQGLADGSFTASEMGLLAGYGAQLWPGLSLGGQARYSRQQLADVGQDLWEGTGGLLFRPWDGVISLGAAWTAEQDALKAWQSSAVNVGLAWRPALSGDRPLAVSLQGQWLTQDRGQVTLGAEWKLSRVATLRGAWQEALYQDSAAGALGIWCVGAGLANGSWTLDYGVVTDHPLGFAQRLSLGYAFGQAPGAPADDLALAPEPPAPPVSALPVPPPMAMPTPLPAPAPSLPAPAAPRPSPAVAPLDAAPSAQFGLAGALPSEAYVQAFQSAAAARWMEALALCRNGIAANPGDALCWREMGLVYDQLGRPDYARPCMTACLRLRPDDAEALQWMQRHPGP
ncbi:MAG TPA: hypothetical protein VNZ54_00810 [bacterium]|nr:hypothetical protein [bacterium]